ncbi:MAG: translation initiation factor 2 [Pleomorphochaeta sp.]
MDLNLPYLLKPQNICYFNDSSFFIGNRKKYPIEKSYYKCTNCNEIAVALKNMITQGGAPLQIALTAFRYIASEMERTIIPFKYSNFEKEIMLIVNARPTNTTMKRCVENILNNFKDKFQSHKFTIDKFVKEINLTIDQIEEEYNETYYKMGKLGATLIKDNDVILTTCFAEHTFLLSVYFAIKSGKNVKVLVNETRPYFQGSRLTAPSLKELGVDVKIITDGMGSYFMRQGLITHYMSAADLVCMDGSVINKIGTNQNAICAKYYNIPYSAFAMAPDKTKLTYKDVNMEYRDSKELLVINGKNITEDKIDALYPSFDIIESNLVTNIITNKGVFKPNEIRGEFL